MPVVGILLVTSEWSQRTAMITFTLVPHRSRVLVAKLLAGLLLAPIAYAVPGAGAGSRPRCSAAPTATRRGRCRPRCSARPRSPSRSSMLAGIAFGAVLLASAPAIVLYFVLPTAWWRSARSPR